MGSASSISSSPSSVTITFISAPLGRDMAARAGAEGGGCGHACGWAGGGQRALACEDGCGGSTHRICWGGGGGGGAGGGAGGTRVAGVTPLLARFTRRTVPDPSNTSSMPSSMPSSPSAPIAISSRKSFSISRRRCRRWRPLLPPSLALAPCVWLLFRCAYCRIAVRHVSSNSASAHVAAMPLIAITTAPPPLLTPPPERYRVTGCCCASPPPAIGCGRASSSVMWPTERAAARRASTAGFPTAPPDATGVATGEVG